MKSQIVLFAALLLTVFRPVPASGDTDFETARLQLAAANPPGVSLTLSLPGGKTRFHRGEVIPLTAVFASSLPGAYQLNTDRGSRDLQWGGDAFHVDASQGAVDPLRVYYDHEFGMTYDGPGPRIQPLAAQPITISYTLNEWLRFDAPGHYQVYLTSGRVMDAGKRHQDLFFFQGRATASNAVDLEILPDDPAWDAQMLQQALPLFNAHDDDPQKQDARDAAVQVVRFLGTPDAARAMIARYGHLTEYDSWNSAGYYQTRLGLFGFPQPAFVIQEMKRKIADPDFPIFTFFLEDLAQTQFLAAYPQPVPPFVANDPVKEKERQAALRRRSEALTALTEQSREELAAAVPAKRGKARAVSLYTLLAADDAHPSPASHRAMARALVPVFGNLTPEEQESLLGDEYWPLLRGPAMLPILRRLYAVPPPEADPRSAQGSEAAERSSLALRRLTELSPAEGRALLLAEIKSIHPRVDLKTLCSLPDRTLPGLDAALAAGLEKREDLDGLDLQSALVERYATAAILPRVKAVYGDKSGEWACTLQSNLLSYFLRTDRAYGVAQMKKALAARKDTACYHSVLSDVAALYMCPDIERLAVAHLHDPDTEVEADAAQTLGAHGSPAAEDALWDRLREWHRQWQGKADKIEPTDKDLAPIQGQLEWHLCDALAVSPAWLATPTKLQQIESLCVTENERNNVHNYLQSWTTPLRISYGGDEDTWSIAQYNQLASFAALETKLAEFPRGTQFLLSAVNLRDVSQQDAAYRRLRPFLEQHGLTVMEESFPTR